MKTIWVTVYSGDISLVDLQNTEASDAFFQEILNLIPEEFRSSAAIACGRREGLLGVYYSRPETEEETQAREREAALKAEKQRLKKLAEFEKLKSELGL